MHFDGNRGPDTARSQVVRLPTSGSAVTIPKISCSVSSGNERSSNSPSPVRIRSKATLKIKTATTNAAMGSAMRHRCPRK